MAHWDVLGLQEQDSTNLLAVVAPFAVSAWCVLSTPNLFNLLFTYVICKVPVTPLSPFSPLSPAMPGIPKIKNKLVRAKLSHKARPE